jgi:hypothetical protein
LIDKKFEFEIPSDFGKTLMPITEFRLIVDENDMYS